MPMQPPFGRDDVELLESELLYQGFYRMRRLRLRHRLFHGGWGGPIEREIMERHDAVGLLLYDPVKDAVGLIEQFRVGALQQGDSPWLLELVAGLIDKDESPEVVATREAKEEAGTDVSALEPVYRYFSSPGGSDEYFHLYCARVTLEQEGIFGLDDEGEDIRLHILPVATAFDLMAAGRISNAHTLVALLWLQRERERLRHQWCG